MTPISLLDKHAGFTKTWHPHRIAKVNDMQVLLAKLQGEFVWHSHAEEDELFQVLKGTLYMQFRDRTEVVREGELIVVPKGVEHCPMTQNDEVVEVMLFEKMGIAHTGEVQHEKTVTDYPEI
ncbi:cupin domain-containing protein [Sediminicola luteus]|uniref:Mannose-6-phosphate isomerase n=1 Tax=Sediminicola luteus TaxID=319238 RepID=A0A2A4GCI4_9FLAO|nr:cupin domain-containing protein [Sediminicola luteus]PCE66131.1 mannose-6-phosphate isomerase [Sediminicola luteus]